MERAADIPLAAWRATRPADRAHVSATLFAAVLIASACLSAALASWLPLQFSIVTVFLFAGPHNWFELRYFMMRLPARFGRSRNFFVVAFAGIAKPERFFRTVESMGIHTIRCVVFPDHHHYSRREIDKLGGDVLITTEKDAVRLAAVTDRSYSYVRISAKIADFDRLMSLIMSRLPKT